MRNHGAVGTAQVARWAARTRACALVLLVAGFGVIVQPGVSYAQKGEPTTVATPVGFDLDQLDPSVRSAVVEARNAAGRAREFARRARSGETQGLGSNVGPTGNHYDGQTGVTGITVDGEISMPDGVTYFGQFVSGDPTHYRGYGVYTFADGSIYEGQWANDQYNGLGVYWDPKGQVDSVGIWTDNNLTTSLAR